MSKIQRTDFYSEKIGCLAEGCKQCVKGEKLVLFVTGLCSQKCWYCPLSETKKNKDVVYANEWEISKEEEIIREAKLCNSKGASLTGGDPFLKLDRSVSYVKLLKKTFGKKFHIHLYAPMKLLTLKRLEALRKAGIDEIRLHPDFLDKKDWKKIDLVRKFKWKIGVEIPLIPSMEKEIKSLIDYFSPKINFLNLNELEQSDTNVNAMIKRKLKTKGISYAVEGSEELAKDILKYCLGKKINVHYCRTKLKDAVQLANRLKRRAKNVAADFDIVNEDGTLLRGAIYLGELVPGFGYRKKLVQIMKNHKLKKSYQRKLKKIRGLLMEDFDIPENLIFIDYLKLRLLIEIGVLERIKHVFKQLRPAIVEEYPTHDQMELSIEFL